MIVPLELSVSLFLAYLLNDEKMKGRGLYRTMYFVPVVTTASVAVSYTHLDVYKRQVLFQDIITELQLKKIQYDDIVLHNFFILLCSIQRSFYKRDMQKAPAGCRIDRYTTLRGTSKRKNKISTTYKAAFLTPTPVSYTHLDRRAPVLCRNSGPSGIQIPPESCTSFIQRIYSGGRR